MSACRTGLRALPRRFRRQRLLIIGCGDIGQRLARLVEGRWRVYGIVRGEASAARVRAAGALALLDGGSRLDDAGAQARALAARRRRFARLATLVVHAAPPATGAIGIDGHPCDPLTRHWATAIRAAKHAPAKATKGRARPPTPCRATPRRIVYLSTTGVYGDRGGRATDEATPVAPGTERARRRNDAERALRGRRRDAPHGRHGSGRWSGSFPAPLPLPTSILRVPGIYAIDRLPLARIAAATPVLIDQDDVRTNHVEAGDLARATLLALLRAPSARVYNVVDSTDLKMGEYMDRIAAWAGLAPCPRVARAAIAARMSPMALSFMGESRRLLARRLTEELGFHFRYPSIDVFLAQHRPPPEERKRSDGAAIIAG